MKLLSAILSLCALTACATAPPSAFEKPEAYFHDALFASAMVPVDAGDVFALDDAMRRYLRVDIARQLRLEGAQRGLIRALQQRGQLKLEYDAGMTRNAVQAFDARAGNCLSLVIMTAAFAKELGLQVSYQSVDIDETWSRSGDIAFSSGHVNLTLSPRTVNTPRGYDENRMLTIDFLPAEDILGQRTRPITEDTVLAMYLNNRAAESLAAGELTNAYWWARAAIRQQPTFASAYNTLAVVYLRHGDLAEAEPLLQRLIERRPDDRQALSNLAMLYDKQGRSEASRAMQARLARIEPYPPYHFFNLGTAAMQRGDYRAAKTYFSREVERADYNSEFHFWLGIAALHLGDVDAARKELAIALQNSTTRSATDLYAAKLDRLRAHPAH